MKIEELKSYEILEQHRIDDIGSESWLLRHKKSGAKLALLSNEDENKVFCIGFRTPPSDSTGVAHILEHSVLEGSRDFPVKDPFIELVKGSLNTFLNAMTYPDKTVYPAASCNDKDFQNLMHVYLDAVFYPNIYKEPRIFYQEGWHYEMENPEDELKINGVVYNEMKGAFSSPDDVLERAIMNSLYPDTAYSFESGGDPDDIPKLTYEQFLSFHQKYYHPANGYIFLYGNMDMVEKLIYLDEKYLSHFDKIDVESSVQLQRPFVKPVSIRKAYPVTDQEPLKDNTYLAYNIAAGDNLNQLEYIAFQILDYVLCSAPGAPLKKALTDAGIGKEVYSFYDNGVRQPYFSIVAKNTNENRKDEFVSIIEKTLEELSVNGLDKKALKAGINYYEFKYREADFGSYPAGLMYGLQMLDSWIYDDAKPFIHIEAAESYQTLKTLAKGRYFEELIAEKLLHNNHKTILTVVPVRGLAAEKEKALKEQLQTYKAQLDQEAVERIIEDLSDLRSWQEEEDSPEALASIPLLERKDIRTEAEDLNNDVREKDGTTILFHPSRTNGISYFRFLFDTKEVSEELFPYLGLLKAVLGYVDTRNYSFSELFHEMNIRTGGILAVMNTYTNARDLSSCRVTFEFKGKALDGQLTDAMDLMKEIMLESKFDDTARLYQIIAELKSRMQSGMMSSGHNIAVGRALSYISRTAAISEVMSGMPFYRLIECLEADFDNQKEKIVSVLKNLSRQIFRPENLILDLAAKEEQYEIFADKAIEIKKELYTDEINVQPFAILPVKKNEGFCSSSQVQYVCRAGNFIRHGLPYTGALRVMKVLLSYEYMWTNIRVKGGAYDSMCNFGKSGDSYMVSYRDPNLRKTVEVYEKAADFVESFDGDERTMTQYIIGAISSMDIPLGASGKALRSMSAWMTNQTKEDFQKERDEVLSADAATIRSLASYIRAVMEDDCFCVVGNDTKIKEEKDMFLTLENLFQN